MPETTNAGQKALLSEAPPVLMSSDDADGAPRVLPAALFRSQHRSHVLLFNLLPALATVGALAVAPWFPPKPYHLALAVLGWCLTGIGVTVGYHRLFTHRSFDAAPSVRWILAVLGSMAGQGPVSAWVAIHRRHHERSDGDGDPHSPAMVGSGVAQRLRGLWHAHVGWLARHDVPNPLVYARDVLKDRVLVFCNRNYLALVVVGLAAPGVAVGSATGSLQEAALALLWAGAVRLFVTSHFVYSVNSICHAVGSQDNATGDSSRNNSWLAIPTLGESWHNNHHAQPTAARFGFSWWQIDVGYGVIWCLERAGLITNVHRPQQGRRKATKVLDEVRR